MVLLASPGLPILPTPQFLPISTSFWVQVFGQYFSSPRITLHRRQGAERERKETTGWE